MKFKNKLFVLLAIIVLTLAACDNSDDASDNSADNNEEKQEVTTITVSGSGSMVSILSGLEADFEADNPNYDLNILAGSGTGGGVSVSPKDFWM